MRLTFPEKKEQANLTIRADAALLAELDELLEALREKHPERRASLTRTWLVAELLRDGMAGLRKQLDGRR